MSNGPATSTALAHCHLLGDQNREPNALASGFVRENIAPQSPRLAPSAQSSWHGALPLVSLGFGHKLAATEGIAVRNASTFGSCLCPQSLAGWAEKCRALSLDDANNFCGSACETFHSSTPVDLMMVLVISGLIECVAVGAIRERRAFMGDGCVQDASQAPLQLAPL